jgi:hypothetical protein
MASIHNDSVAIFNHIPVNEAEEKVHWVDIPASRWDDKSNVICFTIPGDTPEYTCLRDSYFLLDVTVDKEKLPEDILTRARRAVPDDDDEGRALDIDKLRELKEELDRDRERAKELEDERYAVPIDSIFNSMWNRVDVYMNHTLVSTSSTQFMYKSYIETVLNNSHTTKKHQLKTSLGFTGNEYSGDHMEQCKVYPEGRGNAGLKERHKMFKKGRIIGMMGYLASDIMGISGCIPNGVNITIKLYHNPDSVRLLTYPDDVRAKLHLWDISFQVCKKKMDPKVMQAHGEVLEDGAIATFPFRRTEVRSFDVKAGSLYKTIPTPYESQIPSRLIMGMVSSEAYMGHFQKDPLYFHHYNLTSAAFTIDNVAVPKRPYSMVPAQQLYIEPLMDLYRILGKAGEDKDIGLDRDNYGRGNFLIPFDVTPTTSADMSYIAKVTGGTSSLKLEFGVALPEDITIITYAVFPAEISIDAARSVTVTDL